MPAEVPLFLLLLLACNRPTSCERYVEAYLGCVSESGADTTSIAPDVLCAGAEKRSDLDDYYECLADAFAEGNCASEEAVSATEEAAHAACVAPTP